MKKFLIIMAAVLLAGIVFTGIASAETNYTSVSEIPMAVDFTFMLEFDDAGEPHIVTDYPFESTGATEMVLNYNTAGTLKAVELTYEFNTGETRVVIWNNRYSSFQAANQALRSGQLTVDNTISINTSNYGPETDWFLLYSLEGGRFFQYDEKTYAQPDNGIETGGTIKSASYDADGNLIYSSFMKRSKDADLWIIYDVNGEVTDCRIDPNYRKSSFYSYDKTTGLFNGKKLSELELGFDDEDLRVPAIAALGRDQVNAEQAVAATETEPAKTEPAAVTAEETLVSVGYTSVSQIPMAVDFTVSVEFDDAGNPRVVTDYPFETTGATEMNLTYDKDDIRGAITVNYRAETGKTRIIGFNRKVFPDFDTSGAGDMIRNGVLTLHDSVYVGTTNENEQTDWYLAYSISKKAYVFYEEKTHSQGFNAMGSGGTAKTINYENGIISDSSIIKRMKNADMILNFDQFGNMSKCSVSQYRPESKTYEYNAETGLFDGKKISELDFGFEEADLQAAAPAALGKEQDNAEPAAVTEESERAEIEPETDKTEQVKTESAAVTAIEKPSIEEFTSVSKIPMAVDFTVSVEIDDAGMPHIVTDYPFEAMGATELGLQYSKKNFKHATELVYDAVRKETRMGWYTPKAFSSDNYTDRIAEVGQMIRDGVLTMDDSVWIGTTYENENTDWYLEYSISKKSYVLYEEKTQSHGYNAMAIGGKSATINYTNGKISGSSITKRLEKADLILSFDRYGKLLSGYVTQRVVGGSAYDYNLSTGLFGGKKISELDWGFEEADLQIPAPAALEAEQAPAKTEPAAVTAIEKPPIDEFTSVSKIPMAVDFTVSVEFDDEGEPRIVTDYPFETMGAAVMNLRYDKGDIPEAVVLSYYADTGRTWLTGYNGKLFPDHDTSGAWDMIRNGEVTMNDSVWVGTAYRNAQTDWYLEYSISKKAYVSYEEKTHSQGFNAMGTGGIRKKLAYSGDELVRSYYQKRTENADLCLYFDQFGHMNSCYISQYRPESNSFYYDFATGLFGGKKISELGLGYEDEDLQVTAPAALEAEQKYAGTAKTEQKTESASVTAIEKPSIDEFTSVSKIPMAVDFTVSLEFDDEGKPHVVTDYPFEATGATEMNLVFSKKDFRSAIDMRYDAATKETRFSGYYPQAFSSEDYYEIVEEASKMVQNGELTMEDSVWIGTSFHSEKADWYLEYSISEKTYLSYEEKTHSQGFNAMGTGGEINQISYNNGMLSGSYYMKRGEKLDMILRFDEYGKVVYGYISQHYPAQIFYEYDPATGLFDGKKISELGLGFEDKDVQVYAPAVLKTEQGKTESAAVTAVEKPSMDEFTEVSKIPMAVDFTVSVEFDDAGKPQIVTDYPFEAMGATEMNLEYSKKDFRYAIELTYDAVRKETRFGAYYPNAFSSDDYYGRIEEASQMIRDGVLTMEDGVWVGTTYENEQTDWYLKYSISKKTYVTYEERTQSQGFNAMGAGGIGKTINYVNGTISKSSISKRMENADMILSFDRYGKLLSGYVSQYRPERNYYDYNPTTGLFGGKKISELGLGFEEADPQMPAPAALKAEQEQAETAPATVETEQAKAEPAAPAAEEAPGTDAGQETADPKLFGYKVKEDGTAEITSVKESITDGRIPAMLDGYAVTSIGYQAFMNCNNLTVVIIPEGVKKISHWAFSYCENLKNISLPDSIEEIGQPPILQCYNMLSFSISPNHPIYAFSNCALINKKNMQMITACGMGETYEVSWGITEILEDAFCSSEVKKVILPDSVQIIGMCAFTGATNLEEVFIPEGIKEIGTQAFMHCGMLNSVTIPNSVYSIGAGAFDGCNNLMTVQISKDHPVYEVKDRVLIEKRTMTLVSVAGSIKGAYTVPAGIKVIGTVSLQNCSQMTEIIIPDSVITIEDAAIPKFYDIVCKARKGSCAEKYCKKNGITFEPIK